MKNLFNKMTAVLLVCTIMLCNFSCTKEESPATNGLTQTSAEIGNQEKAIWGWVVAAVAYIVVKVSEGQYSSTTTTNPDGTIVTKTDCTGIGSCAVNATSVKTGAPVSSIVYPEAADYDGKMMIAKDKNDNILLGMSMGEPTCQKFFYGTKINISRPFVIDNPDVLREIGTTGKIVVQGDYIVETDKDAQVKFIVIREK